MQSKHSIEKQTAKYVDCFTTVSDITARECLELLDKPVDKVLPNGFENNFVPKGAEFTKKRKLARKKLIEVANALMGIVLLLQNQIVQARQESEPRAQLGECCSPLGKG